MNSRRDWTVDHYRVWTAWQEQMRKLRTRATSMTCGRALFHAAGSCYRQLQALLRRVRRPLQRQWKQSMSCAALLLALGQGQGLAASVTGNVTTFSYDAHGQLSQAVERNSSGTVLTITTYEIGIDGRARIYSVKDELTGNVTTFSYNASNQLSQSVERDSSGTVLTTTTYEIGGDGRARIHTLNDMVSGELRTYIYDSNNQLINVIVT